MRSPLIESLYKDELLLKHKEFHVVYPTGMNLLITSHYIPAGNSIQLPTFYPIQNGSFILPISKIYDFKYRAFTCPTKVSTKKRAAVNLTSVQQAIFAINRLTSPYNGFSFHI
jgi:hypothetical protein